jgi:hypothetical protein
VTVTTTISARQENHGPDLVSSVNTPAARKWVQAAKLRKGELLRTSNGTTATADGGGTVPANHNGWMWDLTVPGNNDHDFYVIPAQTSGGGNTYAEATGTEAVLVHNDDRCGISRAEAKAQALADAGVPADAEPLEVRMEPATSPPYQGGKQLFDENFNPISFRVETYETSDGDLVDLQDHYTGHDFGPDDPGNQPPHFNVRPFDGARNAHLPGVADHYPYDPALG